MGDQVVPLLLLLQTCKRHLCTLNVLFGVLEVLKECVLVPGDTLVYIGSSVSESRGLASLAAEYP
jgi:hypothetical protein